MSLRLGIIAAPEAAGVYRHAILAGFLLDAEITCAFPPSERIAATLLSWERAGISCAVIDEGSYPEGAVSALLDYYAQAPDPLRVILSASRMRQSDDAGIAGLAEAGLFGAIGSWDQRPAAHLKELLTAGSMPKGSTRPCREEHTQSKTTTDGEGVEAGAFPNPEYDACMAEGVYDGCISRLKHGGICDPAWCPRAAEARLEEEAPAWEQPEVLYLEPEEERAMVAARDGNTRLYRTEPEDGTWEEIVAVPIDDEDGNAYIIRDLVLYSVRTANSGNGGGNGAGEKRVVSRRARYLLGRAADIAGGVLLSLALSLAASFIITMFLNPGLDAFAVAELFRERFGALLSWVSIR